ncbi:MAG: hypothetical protein HPKKFMNG_01807 [Planctomycetes bacterium]|nr:hypothetical protein [Planctomycetota bacterium]
MDAAVVAKLAIAHFYAYQAAADEAFAAGQPQRARLIEVLQAPDPRERLAFARPPQALVLGAVQKQLFLGDFGRLGGFRSLTFGVLFDVVGGVQPEVFLAGFSRPARRVERGFHTHESVLAIHAVELDQRVGPVVEQVALDVFHHDHPGSRFEELQVPVGRGNHDRDGVLFRRLLGLRGLGRLGLVVLRGFTPGNDLGCGTAGASFAGALHQSCAKGQTDLPRVRLVLHRPRARCGAAHLHARLLAQEFATVQRDRFLLRGRRGFAFTLAHPLLLVHGADLHGVGQRKPILAGAQRQGVHAQHGIVTFEAIKDVNGKRAAGLAAEVALRFDKHPVALDAVAKPCRAGNGLLDPFIFGLRLLGLRFFGLWLFDACAGQCEGVGVCAQGDQLGVGPVVAHLHFHAHGGAAAAGHSYCRKGELVLGNPHRGDDFLAAADSGDFQTPAVPLASGQGDGLFALFDLGLGLRTGLISFGLLVLQGQVAHVAFRLEGLGHVRHEGPAFDLEEGQVALDAVKDEALDHARLVAAKARLRFHGRPVALLGAAQVFVARFGVVVALGFVGFGLVGLGLFGLGLVRFGLFGLGLVGLGLFGLGLVGLGLFGLGLFGLGLLTRVRPADLDGDVIDEVILIQLQRGSKLRHKQDGCGVGHQKEQEQHQQQGSLALLLGSARRGGRYSGLAADRHLALAGQGSFLLVEGLRLFLAGQLALAGELAFAGQLAFAGFAFFRFVLWDLCLGQGFLGAWYGLSGLRWLVWSQ